MARMPWRKRSIRTIEVAEPQLFPSAFIHGIKRMQCSFTARA